MSDINEAIEQVIPSDMERILEELERLTTVIDNQVTLLQMIKDEVGPVIEKISNIPMFKMFLGGK